MTNGIAHDTGTTPAQRAIMAKELRAGYGVEDIAARHGFEVDSVRAVVAWWRRWNLLDMVLHGRG